MNRHSREKFYSELDAYLAFFAEVHPTPMLDSYRQIEKGKNVVERVSHYTYKRN